MRVALAFALLWMSASTLGAATIETYLAKLDEFRFTRTQELRDAAQIPESHRIPADALREFTLLSLSRWDVSDRSSGNKIAVLEVYEMLDTLGAFGVFSHWDEAPAPGQKRLHLGVDNRFQANDLIFWKGNFFFHFTALSSNDRESLLQGAAERLIKEIDLTNIYPMTVVHLPQEDLVKDSVRYYLGKATLARNPAFPKALLSEIGFEDRTEITFARYQPQGQALFLLGYPTPALSADYFKKFQNQLQAYFSSEGIYMMRSGALIGLFVGPEAGAQKILGQVKYTPTIKWIYDKVEPLKQSDEIPTFLGLIRKSLIGAFIFIGFTLLAGLVAGVVRYRLLERFPKLSERDAMIRLRID